MKPYCDPDNSSHSVCEAIEKRDKFNSTIFWWFICASLIGLIYLISFLPVRADDTQIWHTVDISNCADNRSDIGSSAGNVNRVARPFTPTEDSTRVDFSGQLWKVGSPSDNLVIAVQADDAGLPSGTDLASISVAGTTFDASCPSVFRDFDQIDVPLTNGTQYWIVMYRDGSVSSSNKYSIGFASGVSGGKAYRQVDGVWSAEGFDGTYEWQGQVFLDAGDVESGTSTASTTTYNNFTINSDNQDLFNGILLFFMSFAFIVWNFKKNNK